MSSGTGPAAASSAAGRRVILWFRNDLRLHDNAIIDEAVRSVRSGAASEVLPVS